MFLRLIGLFLLSLSLVSAVSAQTADAEKDQEATKISPEVQKKAFVLLDQTINEADSLKLSENRLLVFSTAADLLWERDEKRARAVAQRAANEIRDQFAEAENIENGYNQIWSVRNQRQIFLTNLANHDADFALQLLEQTRPPSVQNVLSANKKSHFAEDQSELNSEFYLEQVIVSHLSAKNPRRVLETARKMLAHGLSQNLINFLLTLKESNAESAKTLADEILQKANSANLAEDQNTPYFFITLLSQFASPNDNSSNKEAKPLFSETDLRQLAQKLANYYLSAELNQSNYYMLDSGVSVIEKFSPTQAAQIKQRSERAKKTFQSSNKQWDDFNKFAESASPEEMLAQAEKYPPNFRQNLYQQAAQKVADAGDTERARQILATTSKDDNIYSALNNFDRQRFQQFLGEDKLDKARQVLSQITSKTTKVSLLVQLALHFNEKKDKDAALQTIDEARSLINPNPENFNELNEMSEIIRAYTAVAPKNAFDLLESLMAQGNEVLSAFAVINKFQPNNQSFRNGEFVISNGLPQYASSFLGSENFSVLAKNDFERTLSLADKIQRPEIKIFVHLEILRGVIAPNSNAGYVTNLPIKERGFVSF